MINSNSELNLVRIFQGIIKNIYLCIYVQGVSFYFDRYNKHIVTLYIYFFFVSAVVTEISSGKNKMKPLALLKRKKSHV